MSVRVWAPGAEQVELILGEQRRRMRARDGGWWESREPVPPGVDYAFALDGGPALPDPRAERLARGVHGASQRVDHDAFGWHDDGWWPPRLVGGVLYELHVGTFTPEGTLDAAVERLDHLVALGVSHVELMPVQAFPGRHGWGYDVAGFYAVHEPYGGPEGLKRFVDAAHARGLGVILDVVYNHMGPEGCYLGSFGPYLTDRFRTPWGGAINLGDAGSDEVRRFIIGNALTWLRDYHIDALRLDAVHAFVDLTAVHALEELAVETERLGRELGRELTLVAESDLNDPRLLWSRESGGYGLAAQWSDDFHHALHTTLTGERGGYYEDFAGFEDLVRVLERGWAYEGRFSPHRGRRHGRPTTGLALERFVGYAQNHDQVGNRAAGERLSGLVTLDALRVAAALTICGPFTPLLFQGEEWGAGSPFRFFTDYGDPDLAEAVRVGRRREFAAFGWRPEDVPDPQSGGTFEASRLDWSEPTREPHAGLLAWYRQLIALRRTWPPCPDPGRPTVRAAIEERWLVLDWRGRSVAVNLADREQSLPSPADGRMLLAASHEGVELRSGSLRMPPISAAVLESPSP